MDTSPSDRASNPGIELTLRNLSLSIIPPPSLLTRTARKLRLTSDPYKQTTGVDAYSGDAADSKSDCDLRNVGINIYRKVDLTVKPGQGRALLLAVGSHWPSSRSYL
jgi:hypothetical protein